MAKQRNKGCGNIRIDPARDKELICKLKAVKALPSYVLIKLNTLARNLLNEKLDDIISREGITVNYQQPAKRAG